jgi:hypothetical protein
MTNVMSDSAKRAASALGQSVTKTALAITGATTKPVFTVAGGRVVITSLSGVVTTVFQTQTNNIKFVATPTTGTVNDLSANVDATGLVAGGLIGVVGLAADATVISTGGGVANLRNPIVVNPGTIGFATSASSTGAATFTLTYVPLDDGATVTAV